MPSVLAFHPGDHPILSCLVDILFGGHGDCYSSRCTLVSRVSRYATGILDSVLSKGGAPAQDVYMVTNIVGFL